MADFFIFNCCYLNSIPITFWTDIINKPFGVITDLYEVKTPSLFYL